MINTIENTVKYSTLCRVEEDLEQGRAKLTLIKDFVKFLSRTKTIDSDVCLKNETIVFDEKTGSIKKPSMNQRVKGRQTGNNVIFLLR